MAELPALGKQCDVESCKQIGEKISPLVFYIHFKKKNEFKNILSMLDLKF